jgi:Phage tail tube protein
VSNPTYRSFLGIAKEATKGTYVASTFYIPVRSMVPVDDVKYLPDAGWRGSMAKTYGEIQGVTGSTYEFGGDVFADGIGFPLAGILGDVTTTGGGAPFSHAMSLKNSTDGQCTAYSLADFDVTNARGYTGQQFEEVTFKYTADGLLEYTAKSQGFASAVQSTPTNTYTVVTPEPNWECTTTIGGGSVAYMTDGEFTLKRTVTRVYTMQNLQTPYRVWQGPIEVTGKMTFVMEDDTELTRYLTNTQPSLDLNWTHGASAALVQLKLHCTKAAYVTAAPTRGKDYIEMPVTFTAIANSTDAGASGGLSPVKATLQNALPASTYV